MAISSSRLSTKNVADLVKKDFITATDKSKDTPPNTVDKTFKPETITSKLAVKIGKKNIFETTIPGSESDKLISLGIHPDNGDPRCSNKSTGSKSTDDRDLNSPSKSNKDCPSDVDMSLVYESVLNKMTKGMPEYMVKTLENSIGNQLQKLSKSSTIGIQLDKANGIIAGVNGVKKALSEIGDPISRKINLKKLLSCPKNNGLSAGDSDLILDVIIAGLLAQAICVSPKKMVDAIIDIANSGNAVKGSIVKGIVNSFMGMGDKSPADKVKILAEAAVGLGGLTGTDIATTKNFGDKFLNSLSNAEPGVKAPAEEHSNMMSALETLDPDWSKSSDGGVNVGKAKGNSYLSKLSSKKLKTRNKPANEITTTPDEDDDLDFISKMIIAASNSKPAKSEFDIPIPGF